MEVETAVAETAVAEDHHPEVEEDKIINNEFAYVFD